MKVRKKNTVSFPELITEYGKVKRHSMEKTVENKFWAFFNIFGVFGANFPGKRKWEQVDSRKMRSKCDRAKVARW